MSMAIMSQNYSSKDKIYHYKIAYEFFLRHGSVDNRLCR